MLDQIEALNKEFEKIKAASVEEVEKIRIKYISKKGIVSKLFADFKNLSPEQKKEVGKALNDLKSLSLIHI